MDLEAVVNRARIEPDAISLKRTRFDLTDFVSACPNTSFADSPSRAVQCVNPSLPA